MKQRQNRLQIFLLNGPPYCGKDSLAKATILGDRTFGKMEFAHPIKQANLALFGLSDQHFEVYESSKTNKEMKRPELMGQSWREVCIALPEEFVKPFYGKEAFGHFLVNRIRQVLSKSRSNDGFNIIISDCGFTDEVRPLIKAFGAENVHVIKIHRPGSSYKDDSRGYIDCQELGVGEYFIRNSRKEMEFHTQGFRLIQAIKHGNLPNTTPFSEEEAEKPQNKKVTRNKADKSAGSDTQNQ